MSENEKNNDLINNTDTKQESHQDEYEDICYICRRPESVAGKMVKIPNNICICHDCMQKTFDGMNASGFGMNDMMNMGGMPNIGMINLSDMQGFMPNNQKLKKKKPKEEKKPVLDINNLTIYFCLFISSQRTN